MQKFKSEILSGNIKHVNSRKIVLGGLMGSLTQMDSESVLSPTENVYIRRLTRLKGILVRLSNLLFHLPNMRT